MELARPHFDPQHNQGYAASLAVLNLVEDVDISCLDSGS